MFLLSFQSECYFIKLVFFFRWFYNAKRTASQRTLVRWPHNGWKQVYSNLVFVKVSMRVGTYCSLVYRVIFFNILRFWYSILMKFNRLECEALYISIIFIRRYLKTVIHYSLFLEVSIISNQFQETTELLNVVTWRI